MQQQQKRSNHHRRELLTLGGAVIVALFLCLIQSPAQITAASGAECVGCTIVFRSMESYVNYKEQPIEKSLSEWCSILPDKLSSFCKLFIAVEASMLIKMFEEKQTPDVICRELGPCKEFPQCTLFKPSSKNNGQMKSSSTKNNNSNIRLNSKIDWIKELLDIIAGPFERSLGGHLPLVDIDGDMHSSDFGFRGSAWRGKDCNDNNAAMYPGRRTSNQSPLYDHNCNGIYGYDKSGKSYEDLFCNSTTVTTKGVVVFGDSLSAHFRIPQQLFEPQYMTAQNYKQLWEIASNEADWPMLSWSTGFLNDTFSNLTPGSSSSIYKHMRNHNRCMHRDYSNIAVNGARTGAMKDISLTYKRDQKNDQPVLAFYALVGNDVCHPEHNLDFTTPAEFEANVLVTLNYLDQTLPAGSSVVFIGMAEGGFLFEFLKDQMHPLGVTYPQMYDFLNCLESNPCYGWMNTNATIRNITSNQAALLSTVYDKIIQKYSFKNFKMYYHEFPLKEVVQMWVKQGGQPKDLIEPFDGFHLSQPGQSLMADFIWGWIKSEHPEIIGSPNPNNAQIINIFGEQGGY